MKDQVFILCDKIRQTAFSIHHYLGCGHLEKVYENALVHRLQKVGLQVEQQTPLTVYDEDGTVVGDYFADLLIEDSIIVELKAVRTIAEEHVAQLLGYLKAAQMEHGLLLNFGAPQVLHKKVRDDAEYPKGEVGLIFAHFCVLCGPKLSSVL